MKKKEEVYYAQERKEMFHYIPETARTVLDVGCGKGNFSRELKRRGATVWGIEIMEPAAFEAREVLDKVLVGGVEDTMKQLPEQYFDCIICNDVLEHLQYPDQVLLNLKNNLTPNGIIVCSIPNIRYWRYLRMLVFKKDWKYEDSGVMDRTHFRFFTRKSIQRMFEELGFHVVKLEGINPEKSFKFDLFNFLFLLSANDSRYQQYACVVKS